MKTTVKILVVITLMVSFLASCVKKEFDTPPIADIPIGTKLTVADLYKIYKDSVTNDPTRTKYTFSSNYSLYVLVTMGAHRTGNIYKSAYVSDHTGAINLHFDDYESIYEGDSIRIQLNGLSVSLYSGIMQIDGVDAEKDIVKTSAGNPTYPVEVTLEQIISKSVDSVDYKCRLVRIKDVQFNPGAFYLTWADAENFETVNHYLEDTMGYEIPVRTSGYSNFAGETVPVGFGDLVGIVSYYGSSSSLVYENHNDSTNFQFYLRSAEEVNMSAPYVGDTVFYLYKDFRDGQDIDYGAWTRYKVSGEVNWDVDDHSNRYYANISTYQVNDGQNEAWYISRAVDLSGATAPYLNFNTAFYVDNDASLNFEVLVSMDYPGKGDPNLYTWTALSPILSTGYYSWANSGKLDLTPYKSTNTRIAFVFNEGNDPSSSNTCEVDDIYIAE